MGRRLRERCRYSCSLRGNFIINSVSDRTPPYGTPLRNGNSDAALFMVITAVNSCNNLY